MCKIPTPSLRTASSDTSEVYPVAAFEFSSGPILQRGGTRFRMRGRPRTLSRQSCRRVIRTPGQDPVPMHQPASEQMQSTMLQLMPTMGQQWPQGFGQQPMYSTACNMTEMQMQQMPPYPQYYGQQQLPTYNWFMPASPALHQAPEQHQERTGEQTGLPLERSPRRGCRPRWEEDEDEDIGDIGACRAV